MGQGPACAKACPTHAISFGTKDEMKAEAADRVKDLNSRGYKNAGLYDPPGVGGTHVMYVLQHADKPHVYNDLPDNPRISGLVQAWKGAGKYAGLALIGFAAVASAAHAVFAGPNRVSREDEEHGAELTGEGK